VPHSFRQCSDARASAGDESTAKSGGQWSDLVPYRGATKLSIGTICAAAHGARYQGRLPAGRRVRAWRRGSVFERASSVSPTSWTEQHRRGTVARGSSKLRPPSAHASRRPLPAAGLRAPAVAPPAARRHRTASPPRSVSAVLLVRAHGLEQLRASRRKASRAYDWASGQRSSRACPRIQVLP